jgi:hypothetical protein
LEAIFGFGNGPGNDIHDVFLDAGKEGGREEVGDVFLARNRHAMFDRDTPSQL